MIWYGGYDINVDTRGSRPGFRIMFLRFWKSTLKTYVRKKDVDFFKLQLWTGSVVLVSMERGCCQNAVQKCTLLNISSHSRVHFMENWLCQFVQMGHAKQLTKPIFWLGRGKLVVRGTNRWYFERNKNSDDDDDKNNRISTNQIDNSAGDDGGEYGVRGRGCSAPRAVTTRTCAHRSGEIGIIVRDGREFRLRGEGGICPRGIGGGRPPTMVGLPHTGAWKTRPQTPYATKPKGVPLGKLVPRGWWVLTMVGRPCTGIRPTWTPPPCTPSPLGGYPHKNLNCGRDTHFSREDGHLSGSGAPAQGQPQQPVTARHFP